MKKWDLKIHFAIHIVCIVLVSFLVYFFSFESKVKILSCTGNYYLTDQQIYQMAEVDLSSRLLFVSENSIQKKLLENPFIEKVDVQKGKDKLNIHVQEKTMIGYYVKKGKNFLVCNDGSRIELDEKYIKSIIHLPLINGFTDKQISQICAEFKQYDKYLTREVIEKIAEIVPYKISYDKNMLKLTMQDGNVVYSRMSDLMMMSRYEGMLEDLYGQSVCLVLDADNSVITKTDCAYMNMNDEDRKKYHKEEEKRKKEYEEQKEKEEDEKEETDEGVSLEQNEYGDMYANDWISTGMGYVYSPSLNLYKDPSTNKYFVWDNALGLVPKEN